MGGSSGGTTVGAASQSQAPQAQAQTPMSTIDFAKQFAPMATSLADFQRTNHYTPQDYIQAYVQGSQPTKAFDGYNSGIAAAKPVADTRQTELQRQWGIFGNGSSNGLLGGNSKIGGQ